MDKYTYSLKVEKIQKLVRQEDYEAAAKIADTMDWEQEHNVRLLTAVAEAYEKSGQYTQAIDVLLTAYEHSAIGKRIMYQLTELALKAGRLNEAETFYKKYLEEAPDENNRYILRYEIADAKGEDLDKRIAILETYKKYEFEEEWAYKLAELYHRAGKEKECVSLCDEIILWFGVGPYVDKAMELKETYEPLTIAQKERRENKQFYEAKVQALADEMEEVVSQKLPKKEVPAEEPEEAGEEEEEEELPVIGISREVAEAPLDEKTPVAPKGSFAGTLGAAVKKMADRAEAAVAAAEKAITSQAEPEETPEEVPAGGEAEEKAEKKAEAEAMEALGESVGKYMTEEPETSDAETAEEPVVEKVAAEAGEAAEEAVKEAAETAEETVAAAEETAKEAAEAVAAAEETAKEAAEAVAEKAEAAVDTAEETVAAAEETTKEAAEAVAEKAEETTEAAVDTAEETVAAAEETAKETAEAVAEKAEETAEAAVETAEAAADTAAAAEKNTEIPKLDDVIFMEVVEADEEGTVPEASFKAADIAGDQKTLTGVAGVTEEALSDEEETAAEELEEAAEKLSAVTERIKDARVEAAARKPEEPEEAAEEAEEPAEEAETENAGPAISESKVREIVEKKETEKEAPEQMGTTRNLKDILRSTLGLGKEVKENLEPTKEIILPPELRETPEPGNETPVRIERETPEEPGTMEDIQISMEEEPAAETPVESEEPAAPENHSAPVTESAEELEKEAISAAAVSDEEPLDTPFEVDEPKPEGQIPLAADASVLPVISFEETERAVWEDQNRRLNEIEPLESHEMERCIFISTTSAEDGVNKAVEALEEYYHSRDMEAGPIAKIKAEKLNRRGLENSLPHLTNKDLIIESANGVDDAIIREMLAVMEELDPDKVFVLTDTPENVDSLKQRFRGMLTSSDGRTAVKTKPAETKKPAPARREKAEAKPEAKAGKPARKQRINFERIQRSQELSERDFIRYADYFANELECVIDESGFDALEEEIAAIKKEGTLLTAGEVEDIIEDAADHANRKSLRRIFSSKYDRDGYLILRNRDFQ